MSDLEKIRVNIVDSDNTPIQEVDVLTTTEAVNHKIDNQSIPLSEYLKEIQTYTNGDRTIENSEYFEKGTVFNHVPIKDILTSIIYKYLPPKITLPKNMNILYNRYNNNLNIDILIEKMSYDIKSISISKNGNIILDENINSSDKIINKHFEDIVIDDSYYEITIVDKNNKYISKGFKVYYISDLVYFISNHTNDINPLLESSSLQDSILQVSNRLITVDNSYMYNPSSDNINLKIDNINTTSGYLSLFIPNKLKLEKIIDNNGLDITNTFIKYKNNSTNDLVDFDEKKYKLYFLKYAVAIDKFSINIYLSKERI